MGQLVADRIDNVRFQRHIVRLRCRDSISSWRQKEIVRFVCAVNREDGHQASESWGLQGGITVSDAVSWLSGVISLGSSIVPKMPSKNRTKKNSCGST